MEYFSFNFPSLLDIMSSPESAMIIFKRSHLHSKHGKHKFRELYQIFDDYFLSIVKFINDIILALHHYFVEIHG